MDDKATDEIEVVEGELEDSAATEQTELSTETAPQPQSQAELVVSLTNLINANLTEISTIEKEMATEGNGRQRTCK